MNDKGDCATALATPGLLIVNLMYSKTDRPGSKLESLLRLSYSSPIHQTVDEGGHNVGNWDGIWMVMVGDEDVFGEDDDD